jgi:hypothetical protein
MFRDVALAFGIEREGLRGIHRADGTPTSRSNRGVSCNGRRTTDTVSVCCSTRCASDTNVADVDPASTIRSGFARMKSTFAVHDLSAGPATAAMPRCLADTPPVRPRRCRSVSQRHREQQDRRGQAGCVDPVDRRRHDDG